MLSEKPWKVDAVALLLAGLLFCWSFGILLTVILGQWLQPGSPQDPAFHQFLLTAVSFHGAALVLVTRFLKAHEGRWKEFLGLVGPRLRRALVIAVVAGAIMVPAALALNKGCGWLLEHVSVEPVEQRTVKILQVSVGWPRRILFGLGAIVLAPLVEETLFRGILYPFLKPRIGLPLAVTATTLTFAAIHTNLVTFVPLTFIGLVLVWVYERTDNLLAPIVTHALFNAVNFVMLVR